MRALILFLIGIAFGTAGGFLLAGGLGDASHDHSTLIPWQGAGPALGLALPPDTGSAQNLHIMTTRFTYAPEAVNGQPIAAKVTAP